MWNPTSKLVTGLDFDSLQIIFTQIVVLLPCQLVGRWGLFSSSKASLVAQMVKNLPAMQETWLRSLGREDPLEKEMTTHSSTLTWEIPWTEEPGGLPSMGLQRAGHDGATNTSLHFSGSSAFRMFLLLFSL